MNYSWGWSLVKLPVWKQMRNCHIYMCTGPAVRTESGTLAVMWSSRSTKRIANVPVKGDCQFTKLLLMHAHLCRGLWLHHSQPPIFCKRSNTHLPTAANSKHLNFDNSNARPRNMTIVTAQPRNIIILTAKPRIRCQAMDSNVPKLLKRQWNLRTQQA